MGVSFCEIEHRKASQTTVTLGISMARWEFRAWYSQAVILLPEFGVDNPARQNGQARFDIGIVNTIKVKPLTAGVGARKQFGIQVAAARISFPRDVTW
jgi:hypothetical protein